MFSACLESEPNVYLVDVVFETKGDETTFTYIYSNGQEKTKTIKNQGELSKAIVDISKKPDSDCIYIISYEDGTTEEITMIVSNSTAEKHYENKVIETYNKVVNSAVIIRTSRGTGSGVVYSMDKSSGGKTYILTNHHVVEDDTTNKISNEITIYPYGSNSGLTATCIGAAESEDVAILMVNTQDLLVLNQYCYAPTIAEDRVLGDTAIAVGNPEDQGMTITNGRVSLEYKYIGVVDSTFERVVFGLDTPINPGNSGGGIFNLDGELIGLADAKMIEYIKPEEGYTENLDNMGYALPIEFVDAIADNIIDQYETNPTYTQAKKIKLGITITNSNFRAEKDANGITRTVEDISITQIDSTGLAYTKFNLRQDDMLTEIVINGSTYSVNHIFDFDIYLLKIRAGDSVKFKYTRGDTTFTSTAYTIKASDITTIVE